MIVGRVYLERGAPVTVLCQWSSRRPPRLEPRPGLVLDMPLIAAKRHGPRNVLIRRGDGSVTCRPFRGLRVPPAGADAQSGR